MFKVFEKNLKQKRREFKNAEKDIEQIRLKALNLGIILTESEWMISIYQQITS